MNVPGILKIHFRTPQNVHVERVRWRFVDQRSIADRSLQEVVEIVHRHVAVLATLHDRLSLVSPTVQSLHERPYRALKPEVIAMRGESRMSLT
jgi:hypothetical protein